MLSSGITAEERESHLRMPTSYPWLSLLWTSYGWTVCCCRMEKFLRMWWLPFSFERVDEDGTAEVAFDHVLEDESVEGSDG